VESDVRLATGKTDRPLLPV